MNRRAFLGTLGGGLAVPLTAGAQQPAHVPRIGCLVTGAVDSPEVRQTIDAFRTGLRERGYTEGHNVRIEYRGAQGKVDRLSALATELVRLEVDLIVAIATPAARAARQATATIPIVAVAMGDPVGDGLVQSLARPGGNLTGTTFLGPQLVPKHLELLKESLPRIALVAVLWHLGAFADSTIRELLAEAEAAARTLRIRLHLVEAREPDQISPGFSRLSRERADALVVFPSTMLFAERRRVAALAARHRLPSIFNSRQAVEAGGLLGYGADLPELIRQSAGYADRILRGARPSDLPVEQPTKFELAVNLKTAKTLGITLPPAVLLRADHVIS